jgi:ectoine hydroxylase-related dioxygenase (phytanoyl-CoA dioxygenase family)
MISESMTKGADWMAENLQTQWENEGYVVVRNLFDPGRTERLLNIANRILAQWRTENPETGKPGGPPSATVMRHLNHPGYFRQPAPELGELLDAVADPQVLAIARTILGEEPLFRCTSCFFNPLENSRDGDWHRDSQFGTPDEAEEKKILVQLSRSGTSIQMQIALTPSDDVEVVPGSHLRWDTPAESRIRKADGGTNNRSNEMPGALRLALEAGDAALFNPYGIHRGRYHTDRLRRTLMFTYTKSSAPYRDYFSKQPWFLEPGYLDSAQPATRGFFTPFVEMYRDFWLAKAN